MWHTSIGRIVYDPRRPGMKKKTQWWCIVDIDREITRYYRWWIVRQLHVKGLCAPSWDAHISVIRGEKPKPELLHLWKKYDKEKITFRYKHFPRQSGDRNNELGESRPDNFWFIEVDCPRLLEIRKELHRPTNWKLHLTVARTWY